MIDKQMVHLIGHIAQNVINTSPKTKTGFVSEYDPDTHFVKLIVPDWVGEDGLPIETGDMQLNTVAAGNGWGIQIAPFGGATKLNPTAGESVTFHIDNAENGFMIGGTQNYCAQNITPSAASGVRLLPGEMLLRHISGTQIHIQSDGTIALTVAQITDTNKNLIGGDLNAQVGGDLNTTCEIFNVAAASANIVALNTTIGAAGVAFQNVVLANFLSDIYNNHTHVDSVGGTTTTPTPQATAVNQSTSLAVN